MELDEFGYLIKGGHAPRSEPLKLVDDLSQFPLLQQVVDHLVVSFLGVKSREDFKGISNLALITVPPLFLSVPSQIQYPTL